MSGKTCSAVVLVAFSLATFCLLSAQTPTTNTNHPPLKPAPAPAHPATPARPPAGSQPSGGQKRPNAPPTRIIREYPSTGSGASIAPVNQSARPSLEPLGPSDSAMILRSLNVARSRMSGVNRVPLPVGLVSRGEDGTRVISTAGRRTYQVRPDGSLAAFWHGKTVGMFRPDGSPSFIHMQDMSIMRGLHGEERFESQLPGGTGVVGWGGGEGYIERPLPRSDGHYVQRTYITGGRETTAVFHTFDYGGVTLATYVPERRYGPAFYAWAAHNWPHHAHYAWPWLNEKWAASYRKHFEREYPDLAAWTADYILAAILRPEVGGTPQAGYLETGGAFYTGENAPGEASQDAAANGSQGAVPGDPIDPAIANGIENKVRQEQAAEEEPMQPPSTQVATPAIPQPTVQQVTNGVNNLSTTTPSEVQLKGDYYVGEPPPNLPDNAGCTLRRGASLHVIIQPQPGEMTAEVIVGDSNPGDCERGKELRVPVKDLLEMTNNFSVYKYYAFRTYCNQPGVRQNPVCAGRPVPEGQTSPALTADAQVVIGQQANRARVTEQAITQDAESESNPSRPTP